MTLDTFGLPSEKPSAYYDRDSRYWKTWPGIAGSVSTESSVTVPKTGWMSGGYLFELQTSEPRTSGKGFSSPLRPAELLPTPRADEPGRRNPGYGRALKEEVTKLFPTPAAQMSGNTPEDHLRKKPSRTQVTDLKIIVEYDLLETGGKLLPTPNGSDASGGAQHPDKRKGHSRQLIDFALLFGESTSQPSGDGNS